MSREPDEPSTVGPSTIDPSAEDGVDLNRPRADRTVWISRLFTGVATLVLLVVVGRVAQLKTAPSDDLLPYISDRVTREVEPSARGDLLDRRGRPLSMSEVGYRVIIDPVAAERRMDVVIAALAESMGVPTEEIGEPLVRAVAANQQARAEAGLDELPSGEAGPTPDTFMARLTRAFERAKLSWEAGGERNAGPRVSQKRYLPVGPMLDREIANLVRERGLPGVLLEKRLVRQYPGGDDVASILGKVGFGHVGLLGAERSLDERLRGTDGRIGFVHDSGARPVRIDAETTVRGERGEDVSLSLDLELQRIAIEELQRGMEDADAAGGRLVMMRPETGEIVAMVDLYREVPGLVPFPWVDPETPTEAWPALPPEGERPRYATLPPDDREGKHPAMWRNRCVEDIYEPGSTFKSFVWASAWQMGVIADGERLSTRPYTTPFGRTIDDVTKRDEQDWRSILVHSSNVGMFKMSERITHGQLHGIVDRFGFGSVTRIGLPGESPGIVTPLEKWTDYSHTSVVIGHEVAVTPVQMVRAFGAYARTGERAGTLPHLRLTVPTASELSAEPVVRVLDPEVATLTRGVLVGVADRMQASMGRQFPDTPEPGYTLFGKSGTAEIPVVPPFVRDEDGEILRDEKGRRIQMGRPRGAGGYFSEQYNSSFIGGAPAEDPRLVVLVVIDDPGPDRVRQRQYFGSSTAGPVVRRVVERSLRYLGVPPAVHVAAGGN